MKLRPRSAVLLAVLAATVVACALTATAQANVQLPGLNGRIAWSSSQAFPAQSVPKGSSACFSGESCAQEIYSMNPDGSDQARLTNNQVFDDEPAWLPADGANIAFESDTCPTGKLLLCSDNLWSMASSGATPGQLTFDAGDQDHPSYSPDGSKLAYEQRNQQKEILNARGIIGSGVGSQIMIVSSGGELGGAVPVSLIPSVDPGPNTFVEDFFPAWSPDGTQIAFTRLTQTVIPDATPDGDTVPEPPGETFILDERTYVASATGGGPAHAIETYPSCSIHIPGQEPVSAAGLQRSLKAGTLRAAAPAVARLKVSFCNADEKPAWSPDGSKLAVSRFSTGDLSQVQGVARGGGVPLIDNGDIVVFNSSDGSGEVDLSDVSEPADCNTDLQQGPFCSRDEYPDWSPDGTRIVFDSDRLGAGDAQQCRSIIIVKGLASLSCTDQIWVMNADGSNVTQLTTVGENFDPDWQRIPPPPPPLAQAASPVKPSVGVAGVRRACVSSSFHVRFRVSTANSSVKNVVVKLDGKRIKSTSKGSFTLTINGKKLKSGKHRLTITATNAAGQVTTTRKSFSVCKAAKPRRKAAPRFTG